MSRGKHFLYDGVWDTMYGHARRLGISTKTVDVRIMRYGNTPENYWRILHVGRLGAIMMTYNGIRDSCEGWARRFGVRVEAIRRRFPDGIMTGSDETSTLTVPLRVSIVMLAMSDPSSARNSSVYCPPFIPPEIIIPVPFSE